jgi:prevent-host-death family protein
MLVVSRTITQRELRNESGEIMRRLDQGETFVVTRRGVPVGELIPVRRRQFASREHVSAIFAGAALLDRDRFRADLDRHLDQGAAPRG